MHAVWVHWPHCLGYLVCPIVNMHGRCSTTCPFLCFHRPRSTPLYLFMEGTADTWSCPIYLSFILWILPCCCLHSRKLLIVTRFLNWHFQSGRCIKLEGFFDWNLNAPSCWDDPYCECEPAWLVIAAAHVYLRRDPMDVRSCRASAARKCHTFVAQISCSN